MSRTFFERFRTYGLCILPAGVLSDDGFIDPDTGEAIPSLRAQVSANGLCYAQVLSVCETGFYWANVFASPRNSLDAARVLLTEEDLYAALPCDVRVRDKTPAHLLTMMAAHAQEVKPMLPIEPAITPELAPAPFVPLEPLATIEVSADELHEVLAPDVQNLQDVSQHTSSFLMQQALLQTVIDSLMRRLYWGQDRATARYLKTCCAAIALVQRWHRQHRSGQRVVNAVPGWSDEQQAIIWQLTVGVPASARLVA